MIRCKCDFPTLDEWRSNFGPNAKSDTHSRAHRVHHDEWDATRNTDTRDEYAKRCGLPAAPPDLPAWDIYLRILKLEEAAHQHGWPGFQAEGIDAVLRQTATGRMEGQ